MCKQIRRATWPVHLAFASPRASSKEGAEEETPKESDSVVEADPEDEDCDDEGDEEEGEDAADDADDADDVAGGEPEGEDSAAPDDSAKQGSTAPVKKTKTDSPKPADGIQLTRAMQSAAGSAIMPDGFDF